MIKRIFCFLLSAMIIAGICGAMAPQVSAAANLKASEKCIELIKEFEGFTAKPVYDYLQYSVGYGSACGKNDYPNGITKAQADKLLREDLAELEPYLDRFLKKNGLALSQQQYDALISFTYNLGTNWMNNTSTFRSAVLNGNRGNDFIFAMTMWCNAGGAISTGLVQRRLAEANLYLNGIYAKTPPANYRYVIFDNNMESAVSTVKIQGFDANQTDKLRAAPSKTGYRFLGWYTKPTEGEWITTVGAGTGSTTLYAHWQDIGADNNTGIPARYVRYASSGQIAYDAPNGLQKKQYSGGEKLTVIADYMDPSGIKWGKLSDGSWVNLTQTKEAVTELPGEAVNLKVVVTADDVNIRKGPGTSYAKAGKANRGQELTLTRVQQGGMYRWGQFSGGWICLDYTDYDVVIAENSANADKVTAIGEIVGADKLNIRSRPGTSNSVVGQYSKGEKVEITLKQQVGSTTWGKTEKGWISLDYVKLTPVAENQTPSPAPGQPENEAPSTPDKNDVIATGTVADCTSLRIRAGAGTKYNRVGSLAVGTKVEIYEIVTVGTQMWGRISKGWICLSYVQLDAEDSGSNQPVSTVTGTVYNCTGLNVRSGAGTRYERVGRLAPGTKVEILETAEAGGQTWGRIAQGWVCMDYIKRSESNSTPVPDDSKNDPAEDDTGKTEKVNRTGVIVGTTQLRVRSAPGVDNRQVGTLNKGDKVVILETAKVGSATWGRTEKGWIHMHYVRLSSGTVPAGSVVRTVTADSLRIRSGAGTSYEEVGRYPEGTQVVITAQTTVGRTVWGRTDKGWISMDYVK